MSEPVHTSAVGTVERPRQVAARRVVAARTDCHQHVWPPAFVEALRERSAVPRLDGWTLLNAGEAPYEVDAMAHDIERRRERELAEGKTTVLVSLSSPLGIEHLPFDEANDLIRVWHESAIALGDPFRVWAATPVEQFDLDGLTAVLRNERVAGLQLPATCLMDPASIRRMKPVLDVVERCGKPVLVHPGPAKVLEGDAADTPAWWPALVPYVTQLHSAWLAWHSGARAQHPALRIAFVALAGLAPLHHERLVARGGTFGSVDPNVYYETSSYDTRAIDSMVRVVGVDPIVHGSDRPYAQPRDPDLGHAFTHALFTANPRTLLTGEPR